MSRYDWNNPPPPGTEYEAPEESRSDQSRINLDEPQGINQIEPSFSLAPQSHNRAPSPNRPHLRSRSKSHDRRRRRKRSRSYSRRSRSYSRNRRRRSRSHSRRRRRKYSSSRSRSRSPGYRHRQRRRNRNCSGSRSYGARKRTYKSRSNSRSHSTSKRSERERKSPKYDYTAQRKHAEYDQDFDGDLIEEEDIKTEDLDDDAGADSQPESDQAPIPFKNDGSFLEIFKKMQEEQKVKEEPPEEIVPKKPVFGAFGKRRGGKVLKTGMVAKVRNVEEDANTAQDAWSVYMQEVRKYKEVHCDDDSKTRPLVK